MLRQYQKRSYAAMVESAFLTIVFILLQSGISCDSDAGMVGDILLIILPILGLAAYWYMLWAYARAKGYSQLLAVMLPVLIVVGWLILVLLPDGTKDVAPNAQG